MSEEPINTTCHLVDHRKKDYTIGHGEDTDKVYYVKKQVGSPVTFTKPVDLIPPCDQDRNTLESSTCDEYRALGPIQYYNCTTCDRCSYRLTVSQYMKDDACADEDRIIQCELENENVTANIQIDPSMSKHSLLKAWQQSGQVRYYDRIPVLMQLIYDEIHGHRNYSTNFLIILGNGCRNSEWN